MTRSLRTDLDHLSQTVDQVRDQGLALVQGLQLLLESQVRLDREMENLRVELNRVKQAAPKSLPATQAAPKGLPATQAAQPGMASPGTGSFHHLSWPPGVKPQESSPTRPSS